MNRRKFLRNTTFASTPLLAGCIINTEDIDINDNGTTTNEKQTVFDSNSPLVEYLDTRPYEGEENITNTIVSIDDPSCPFCSQFREQEYPELYEQYIDTGELNFYSILVDYISEWSQTGIQYLEYVNQEYSNELYFEFLEKFYAETSQSSTISDIENISEQFASENEINYTDMQNSVEEEEYRELLDNIISNVRDSAGITTTPTFAIFIDGELITELSGLQSVETFEQLFNF